MVDPEIRSTHSFFGSIGEEQIRKSLPLFEGEVEIYDGPQKRPKDGVENRYSRLYVESNRANGHSETTLLL